MRTTTRRVPRAAMPCTTPYDTSYAAGRSITGGRGGGLGVVSITADPWPWTGRADSRASRSRRLLRRRRGARGPLPPDAPARRRRRPTRPRRRSDRELRRPAVRHPFCDERGRGAAPLPRRGVPAPPARALSPVLPRRVVCAPGGRAARRAHGARTRRSLY